MAASKIIRLLLVFTILMTWGSLAYSQTTYYSRTNQANPKDWNDANSWTLNSDGSDPAAPDYPDQDDHVVILPGHEVFVDDINDNDGPATSADALDGTGFGDIGSFAASGTLNFYHAGDITVEEGGSLTLGTMGSPVRSMYSGTTFIAGTMNTYGDLINVGNLFFTATATFSSTDDLICTGDSFTRIDIPDAANSFTNDDVYLDHTTAFLCGVGVLNIGVSGGGGHIINLNNGATNAQICTALTIQGCSPDPPGNCPPPTGTYNPTPPVLTGTGGSFTYIENAITVIDAGIGLTYGEPFLTTATISIIGGTYINGEDTLALPETPGFSSSFNQTTGELTISGYGFVSEFESMLQTITYENLSDNPTVADRTVEFEVTDGFATSNTVTRTIEIQAVNDPPDVSTISGSPTALMYDEGDGAVPVDDEIEIEDPDDINLEGATVTISIAYVEGEDFLDFTNEFGVSNGGFNATLGVLTLTGSASIANYQAALRKVTYENTSDTPDLSTRTVEFVVDDGDALSPPFGRDIEITATNDPPVITSTAGTTATEETLYTYTAAVSDPDDANNGTDITWTLSNEPVGMVVSTTGEVTWTPAEGVTTSGTVTLSVEDGDEDVSAPDTEDFVITVTQVNDPPVISSTAPTSATEDVLYTYTASVTDPDDPNNGTDITWTLSNEPAGMVVSSTGVVTWTPGEGVTTSGTVTLSVEDGDEDVSAPDTEDFTITVTQVNDPPVISSTAPTSASEDVLYTYSATVTDPDDLNNGTDITWTLSNEPAGMVVSSTGVVTWTPTEGVTTSGTVTLSVEDGNEDVSPPDTEDFIVTVSAVNDPPVITSTAGTTATEETLYTYTATVTDPDDTNNGTDITWALSNEPAGMLVSTTGVVTWTPGEGVTTSGTVTLSVEDGDEDVSAPDTEDFTITVTQVNDPPIISSTAPTSASEDILYTYAAVVTDPDDANNGTDITWTLSNEPAGMVISSTGVVTWTPTEGITTSGTVTLTVEDGDEDVSAPDTEDFIVTVSAVNDPPVITSTAGTTATEETLYTYSATVSDPDDTNNGTDINWTLSNEPAGMVVSSIGVVTWTPGEGVTTSGAVTLSVEDGDEDVSAADTEDFTITVTQVNDPPVISSTAPTSASEDVLYTYSATVTDPDDLNNGTDITWTLSNEPAGMVVSSTGVVTWTPTEGVTTSGTVTLSVEDGNEDVSAPDTEDFTITVSAVNDPPVIASTAPTTATEETLYTYSAAVTDPDDANNGTDITWTLSNEPAGMVVSTTGVVTWTPTEGVITSGTVTLIVEDGDEDLSPPNTEDFIITVNPVNDPPVISSTAPTTATEDVQYMYTATVVDPDDANNGTDINWTLSNEPAGMVVSSTGEVSWTPGEGVTTSGLVTLFVEDGDEDVSPPDSEDFTITVTALNDPPEIMGSVSDLIYTEGDGPVVLDDQISITDPDDTQIESALISLGTSFVANQDVLSFSDQFGITSVFDAVSGELQLNGTAAISDYITAISSVTYENTSIEPDISARTASFTINDGDVSSSVFTRNIQIIATNEPPVFVDGNGMEIDTIRFTISEDIISTLCVEASDPESNTVNVESVTSSSSDGTFDVGALNDLCFTFSPATNFNGIVYGSITICDDGNPVSCNSAVVEITVLPVNDPPIAVNDQYNVMEDEVVIGNVLDNDSDPDLGDVLQVELTLITDPLNGVININSDGSFEFTPERDFAGQDLFVYRVCDDADPSLCDEAEVTLMFQDIEDPVIAYQLLTPNDDSFNDSWIIDGIEQFPNNTVQVFDRWNSLVYQVRGYNNVDRVWNGESNEGVSTGKLPNGTYFFVINLGNGSSAIDGFVELRIE